MIAVQSLHPLSTGRASGRPTVVLLHSSASSARQWDALSGMLRATHDVHALDLHGHGARMRWTGARAFSIHDDADLAVPILERAGGGHVIGHSYGAAVALQLAASRPRLVHSLALYEPVPFRLLADRAPASAARREISALTGYMRALIAEAREAEAAQRFVDYWSGPGTWARLKAERRIATAAGISTVMQHFDTLFAEPLGAAALARLSMPMLCLHGTQSTRAALHLAALLQSLLPGGRHETLVGMGHMGPITHAAQVNDRLIRFLHGDVVQDTQPAEAVA